MRVIGDALRRIAASELDHLSPNISPLLREDLITSLVRQWITCVGHAGFFTFAKTYWLQLEEIADGRFCVHTVETSSASLCRLLRSRFVCEADIPVILRKLTLRQSAVFTNADGVLFQAQVSPHLRRFEVEFADMGE